MCSHNRERSCYSNAVNELFREVKALGLDVDYLVNNAGFGDHGAFVIPNGMVRGDDRAQREGADPSLAPVYTRLDREEKGEDSEYFLHGGLPARPHDGGLLRHQSLCPTPFRSTKSGVKKRGHYRYNALPGPHENPLFGRFGDEGSLR